MEPEDDDRAAAAGSGVGSAARGVRLLVPLLKATAAGWMRDNAMRLSAALALYTILSLAPLLVITSKLVGALTRDAGYARDQVKAQVTALMRSEVAAAWLAPAPALYQLQVRVLQGAFPRPPH